MYLFLRLSVITQRFKFRFNTKEHVSADKELDL